MLGKWKKYLPAIIALGLVASLVVLAVLVFLWPLPTFITRRFEWEEDGATLFAQLTSNGPMAAGNGIYVSSSTLYLLQPDNPSGEPLVTIWGDANTSGKVSFSLPPLQTADGLLFFSAGQPGPAAGQIVPTAEGLVGFRAHLAVNLNGTLWQDWSQYISYPLEPLDVTVEVSPTSDYYLFLGIKAAAASILVAAAVGAPSAVESVRNLFSRAKE